jgi:ribonuclease T2
VDRRFSLAIVLLLLIAGAAALWLQPAQDGPVVTGETPPPADNTAPLEPGAFGLYVLAVTWQPAFCETEPQKPECRSLTPSRDDASRFALHGLWPSGSYCGVSQRLIDIDTNESSRNLPEIDLSPETRAALDIAMPGTQSYLERHEWLLHGTCSDVPPEQYFSRAIALLDELNASPVRDLFAGSVGQRLTALEIRDAFEMAFGTGAGHRLRIDCVDDGPRSLIAELRIRLYGDVMQQHPLRELIEEATPGGGGCYFGIVDRVGDQ